MKRSLLLFTILSSFKLSSQILTTIAGNGTAGYSGDGGPATSAQLSGVNQFALDANGNLYFSDLGNYAVRKVSSTGIITTFAGGNGGGYSGDGGPATAAQLYQPKGLHFDTAGNLYIADHWNHCIRKVDVAGIITTVAGNNVQGYSGDGGLATGASLSDPMDAIPDNNGNLYISDGSNNCIRLVNAAGVISTYAGTGTAGFSGDGGPAVSAQLNGPGTLALDTAGNLFIGDDGNNRIRMVNTSGVITTICGQSGSGYSGDGGPASAASLDGIAQLNFDKAGNLYIAVFYNHAVRQINTSGIINTVVGGGYGSSLDGSPATPSLLSYPNGVVLDSLGNMYIAEWGFDRIRFVCVAPDSISGLVTEPNANPVNAGQVFVYRQNLTHSGYLDTAGYANINANGTYTFGDLPHGNYFVQAVPAPSYTNALSSYYSNRTNNYMWDSATIVSHYGCNNAVHPGYNIIVAEFAPQTGAGTIDGTVYEAAGYGTRHVNGNVTMGAPLKGVDVKLGRNPGGTAVARTSTSSGGMYSFTNVDTGSYFVFVDIPNFGMDTVLRVHLTTLNPNSAGNDYCVDSIQVNSCSFTTGSKDLPANLLSLYPNPASDVIHAPAGEGELFIINSIGVVVRTIYLKSYSQVIDIHELPAGLYIVRNDRRQFKFIKH